MLKPTIHMGRAYNALKYGNRILDRVAQNQAIISHNALLQANKPSQALSGFGFFSDELNQDQIIDDTLDDLMSDSFCVKNN